jgi:hypothetical protein
VTCDKLTTWGINVIRDVMIYIEHAVMAGYYYLAPVAQYYKSPVKKLLPVKKLPASSSALTEPTLLPTRCNHCGG